MFRYLPPETMLVNEFRNLTLIMFSLHAESVDSLARVVCIFPLILMVRDELSKVHGYG